MRQTTAVQPQAHIGMFGGVRYSVALWLSLFALVLASCATTPETSEGPASVAPSDRSGSQAASSTASASPDATASVETSAAPAAIAVDTLAYITIGGLRVRTEPSTAAEPLGTLPHPQAAFVLGGPVEADGYTWYKLGSPGIASVEECGGEIPQFQCTSWAGWAAGTTPTGDQWVEPFVAECPLERDTATYLSMDAAMRLACAGDDEWRLLTYIAPSGGRGCFPVWMVDPGWMSCPQLFPQSVESEFDSDPILAGFLSPELGECGPAGCPWDQLVGGWAEVVGHLDDPVAETCTSVLNSQIDEPPSPPPDADLTVFKCRLNFVVTEMMATTPPTP